jgi:hypothetical protein
MKVIAFLVKWVGKNLETLFAICRSRLLRGSLQKLLLQYLVKTFKPATIFRKNQNSGNNKQDFPSFKNPGPAKEQMYLTLQSRPTLKNSINTTPNETTGVFPPGHVFP